jgi:hypothetical protein
MTALEQLATTLAKKLDAGADRPAIEALVASDAAALDAGMRAALVERIIAIQTIPDLLVKIGSEIVSAKGGLSSPQTLYRYAERIRSGEAAARLVESELSTAMAAIHSTEAALERAKRKIKLADKLLQPELERLRAQELADEILAEREGA